MALRTLKNILEISDTNAVNVMLRMVLVVVQTLVVNNNVMVRRPKHHNIVLCSAVD